MVQLLSKKKSNWQFLKKLNTELLYDLTIPLLGIYPRKWKAYVHTKVVHEYSQQHYL